mmetsp:Transcript_15010/g.44478  ORF Transcript_15010/g.44478 Transcript_15010/m.44478 type:complete len:209 (-) Transcript_15010:32-658(-)
MRSWARLHTATSPLASLTTTFLSTLDSRRSFQSTERYRCPLASVCSSTATVSSSPIQPWTSARLPSASPQASSGLPPSSTGVADHLQSSTPLVISRVDLREGAPSPPPTWYTWRSPSRNPCASSSWYVPTTSLPRRAPVSTAPPGPLPAPRTLLARQWSYRSVEWGHISTEQAYRPVSKIMAHHREWTSAPPSHHPLLPSLLLAEVTT